MSAPDAPPRPRGRLLDRLTDPGGVGTPDAVDPVRIELDNLRSAHRALRAMTLRMQLLVFLGLLGATLFTPVLGPGRAPGVSPLTGRANLLETGRLLLRLVPADLGDVGAHPFALPAGLALIRVGAALVLAGVLLGLLGSRALTRVPLRTPGAVMASLTAFALVLGCGLLVGGLACLPGTPLRPAFGLVFGVAAGVWLWHGARSLRQLDWDWTDDPDRD